MDRKAIERNAGRDGVKDEHRWGSSDLRNNGIESTERMLKTLEMKGTIEIAKETRSGG